MDKKVLSKKHESFIAEAFDGRTQIASGAIWFAKADVDTEFYLIECKATEKDYYIFKQSILDKIYTEALKVAKVPLLCVRLKDKFGEFKDFTCFNSAHYDIIEEEEMTGAKEFNLYRSVKVDLASLEQGTVRLRGERFTYYVVSLEDYLEYWEAKVIW